MFKNCFIISASLMFLACNSNQPGYSKFLNEDSLPSQVFSVDNSHDTILQTANGAIIKIKKESFSKGSVQLEVKEAYTIEQIILAGLTTQSNGKILSSGGMIYLAATDDDVKINKALQVSIPTKQYDSKMQLYNREENGGIIDWQNPQPIVADTANPYLKMGEQIFQQNCASCHSYDKQLSGPAMSAVEGRGPWNSRERLFKFTRNPAAFLPRTCYTKLQQRQYGQIMPSFPQLSDNDLNTIYDYIKNEDMKRGIVYSTNYNPACDDSCFTYDSLSNLAMERNYSYLRDSLILENESRINLERTFLEPSILFDSSDFILPEFPEVEKVEPINYSAVYYKFDIKTFGWYNVDYKIEPGTNSAELKLEMQGDFKENMSVFIVVPKDKVFAEGGPLDRGENVFGFFERDGKIPLPLSSEVIVFAVGEADGQIVFDFKKFTTVQSQKIFLTPAIVSKREFNRAVKRFRLQGVSIQAEDSNNADQIRKVDAKIKDSETLLELYRPKNCNCNCLSPDSSQIPSPLIEYPNHKDTTMK